MSFVWLILAAHFSRADNTLLMIFSLIVPLLLFIKKRWALLALQLLTLSGALVWLFTIWKLIKLRISMGEDWVRMASILFGVFLITLLAAVLLASPKVKKRYF